jgi:pimeloyl-ACP methyl ester carboxylesterase
MMSETLSCDRRRFRDTAAMTIAAASSYRSKFSGKYSHRILEGIGHNVPQEAPQAFARAIVDVDHS